MDNLNRLLKEAGEPTSDQLLKAINGILDSETGRWKDMLYITTGVLDNFLKLADRKSDDRDTFIGKFKALTNAYSNHLELPLEVGTEQSESAK